MSCTLMKGWKKSLGAIFYIDTSCVSDLYSCVNNSTKRLLFTSSAPPLIQLELDQSELRWHRCYLKGYCEVILLPPTYTPEQWYITYTTQTTVLIAWTAPRQTGLLIIACAKNTAWKILRCRPSMFGFLVLSYLHFRFSRHLTGGKLRPTTSTLRRL